MEVKHLRDIERARDAISTLYLLSKELETPKHKVVLQRKIGLIDTILRLLEKELVKYLDKVYKEENY